MITRSEIIGWLLPAVALVGVAAGMTLSAQFSNNAEERALRTRLDGAPPLRPPFLRDDRACQPRTASQVRLDRSMLEAARTAAGTDRAPHGPVIGYAVSYFAWQWGLSDPADQRSCPPEDEIILSFGSIMDEANWPQGNTEMRDLRLLERLPPTARRANGLAHIAFMNWIPPSNLGGEDSRPYARLLLAEQGAFARPWRDRALREIGGDTRLATSAAYLAVAIAPGEALPEVEKAMAEMLEKSRARRTRAYRATDRVAAIRSDDGNRLIELGYALAKGGSHARPHSAPVIAMLDEVIARPAPPFGLSAAEPTEFCRIARHIGGAAADAADARPFCAPTFRGGDGMPRQN